MTRVGEELERGALAHTFAHRAKVIEVGQGVTFSLQEQHGAGGTRTSAGPARSLGDRPSAAESRGRRATALRAAANSAWACETMRPLNDRLPATRGRSGACSPAVATAARTAAWATSGRSVFFEPASMMGNWKRRVAKLREAPLTELRRDRFQEGVRHAGPGALGQDVAGPSSGGATPQRGHRSRSVDGKRQRLRRFHSLRISSGALRIAHGSSLGHGGVAQHEETRAEVGCVGLGLRDRLEAEVPAAG